MAFFYPNRPHSEPVLLGVSLVLLLVGGGFGPPLLGVLTGLLATRINASPARRAGPVTRLGARSWLSEGHARYVARKTRHLTAEEAAHVDAQVAPSADGRVSWTRFETLVEAAIVAADPEAAAAREENAARETFAKATRSTEHGMRGFYVRADFATIARIDATVAYLARALLVMGDTSTLDQRRVKAVLILANPTQAVQILQAYAVWQRGHEDASTPPVSDTTPQRFDPTKAAELLDETKLLPQVWLFAHLADSPVARVEGSEPVTAEWVRTNLGERCRFTISPVIDPLDQVPVDSYEIPDRHRHAVHLLTPADIFGVREQHLPRHADRPHQAVLQTTSRSRRETVTLGNYGPMVIRHHRIKTHGGWAVRQPFPGIYLWRDPYGAIYLVGHTGTRRIPRTPRNRPRFEARFIDLVLAS